MSAGNPLLEGPQILRLGSSQSSEGEASEAWRAAMARMFSIEPRGTDAEMPRGDTSITMLGEMIANRSTFNAQRISRDRRRIDATPDHVIFQSYLYGGFTGRIGGEPMRVSRGQVCVCDMRKPLDVETMVSCCIGIAIPRSKLAGIDLDALPSRLDPVRERLLRVHMTILHHRLIDIPASASADVAAESIDFVRRLLDPSRPSHELEERALDADRRIIAEDAIAALISSSDLSPAMIAERLGISRATLFRLFEPAGGVMVRVKAMRLQAVKDTLDHPSDRRTATRLAADYGFKSLAHLSRSFRDAYGAAPREWRAQRADCERDDWRNRSAQLNSWWSALGR